MKESKSRKIYLFTIAIIAVLGVFSAFFSITLRIKNTEIPCESIEISTGFNVRIDDRTFDDADLNTAKQKYTSTMKKYIHWGRTKSGCSDTDSCTSPLKKIVREKNFVSNRQ